MKKALGVLIIFGIFLGIFLSAVNTIGFYSALFTFGLAFGMAGLVILAINLIMD